MEGAPSPLQSQFMAYFNADAAQERRGADRFGRRALSGARLYLGLSWSRAARKLTYVWDIYDRTNHRAQRLNDEIALQGAARRPVVAGRFAPPSSALASRSAGELAAYLSNTPEALAAAQADRGRHGASASDAAKAVAAPAKAPDAPAGQALSYAPAR